MPKEVIYSHYRELGSVESAITYPEYVHVGWTVNQNHVEIATVVPTGKIYSWDQQTNTHIEIPATTPGWFVQLDRDGINAMIRALRKARDQAFGKDE